MESNIDAKTITLPINLCNLRNLDDRKKGSSWIGERIITVTPAKKWVDIVNIEVVDEEKLVI
jgi:hypothetical protein|tara:strand:- start:406 stop:591 length:186 start_codon:yes stop_codon:yes gene_type:complete